MAAFCILHIRRMYSRFILCITVRVMDISFMIYKITQSIIFMLHFAIFLLFRRSNELYFNEHRQSIFLFFFMQRFVFNYRLISSY